MIRLLQEKRPVETGWLPILLILAAGLLLRLWGIAAMPFQHDEFSAIFRLNYDSLSALLREGVALRDSHPAGVQVFLFYWTKIFGIDHFWMRLPFVLLGTGSIWLVYCIGLRLFGRDAGLKTAAAMAVMQYFVYYSQMARPYIPGVFFNLLAFHLLLTIKAKDYPNLGLRHLALALSLALAAWVHHFSAFEAGLVFLSGAMLLGKKHRKALAITALMALVLYLPQLGITIKQLRAGGIGDWLGKPELNFLTGYFGYTANFSVLFAAALMVAAFVPLANKQDIPQMWQARLMLLSLFLIPLLLGWLYSVLRVPVLQYSTLIFGFPFLMLVIFSFGSNSSKRLLMLILLAILGSGAFSLIHGRRHVQTMQQQAFREAPRLARLHAGQYAGNYTFVAVSSTPDMFGFYMTEDEGIKHRFFNKREPLASFAMMLDTLKTEYLGLAWADYVPYEWISTARLAYGEVVEHHSWFNAEYYLLRRSSSPKLIGGKERMLFDEQFAPPVDVRGDEYALLLSADTLFGKSDDVVAVSLQGRALDTLRQLKLVMEFRIHPDSMPELWMAGQLHKTILPHEPFYLTVAWRFDSGKASLRRAQFRTYVWNQGREHFEVLSRRAWTATYDKALFGLFKPN